MTAKGRGEDKGSAGPVVAQVQAVAVYQVDLLAEVEGLMRSLTKMQVQVERLRSNATGAERLDDIHQREAVTLLEGTLKTFIAKVETLRETLPEILKAVEALEHTLRERQDSQQS